MVAAAARALLEAKPGVMPRGLVGLWHMDAYQTSPRKVIPNLASAIPVSQSLLTAPRRLFALTKYYTNQSGVAVTDANAVAPDGSNDASTFSVTGAWSFTNAGTIVYPAGTYTYAIDVKLVSGTGTFKIGKSTATTAYTATGSWATYTSTFTSDGATGILISVLQNNGSATATFNVCNARLFNGSSDLGADIPAGHANVGFTPVDNTAVVSGNTIAFSGGGSALIQFPSPFAPTSFTFMALVTLSGSPTLTAYNGLISKAAASWTPFGIGLQLNSNYGVTINSAPPTYQGNAGIQQGNGTAIENANGWAVITHKYDGALVTTYLNDTPVATGTLSQVLASVPDLWVGVVQGVDFSSYKLAAMAMWSRALSDAEQFAAYKILTKRAAASGIVADASHVIFGEGDSITNGKLSPTLNGYFHRGVVAATALTRGSNYAVPSSALSGGGNSVGARLPALLASILKEKAKGRNVIVSLLIGANDLATTDGNTYTTTLFSTADQIRAAGAKLILCTVLSRTDAGDGGTFFNAQRAIVNTNVRASIGTHCDAVADFASDATMGIDTASNNATYFAADKIHPIDAGHALLAPYLTTAINSLS